jgi:anti-anti-sigma regulatory factor
MSITVEQVQGVVPVTVLSTHGALDRSNYEALIAKAQELHREGTRDLLIDMSDTAFMSSAGMVALHAIALLMQGRKPPDPEAGWEAFRSIDRDRSSGVQAHVKLLNPQPQVDRALDTTGLKQFFEVFTDREAAIASFGG